MLTPCKGSYDQPRQQITKQRHHFVNKGLSSQGYGFSSSHVWMWELDYKESWALKNWCFWTVVLEKTLESRLDCKVIKPFDPTGNQSWILIGRTDAEADTPILWPHENAKNWLTGKDPHSGKEWRQDEKEMTEVEMVGWHHWLKGHEFEEAPGVGDGQGSLAYCTPWGHKESDTIEQLNWTELNIKSVSFFLHFWRVLTWFVWDIIFNYISSIVWWWGWDTNDSSRIKWTSWRSYNDTAEI